MAVRRFARRSPRTLQRLLIQFDIRDFAVLILRQQIEISTDSGRLTIQNMKGFAKVTDPIGK